MAMSDETGVRVRNETGWRDVLSRAGGSSIQLGLRAFDAALDAINAEEAAVRTLGDRALTARAVALRGHAPGGAPRAARRVEMFALAREAARRTLGQRPYDEQVVAALA